MAQYTDSKFMDFRIISFNTRGFDVAKRRFCRNLLDRKQMSGGQEISILCNQENFVLRGNKHLIKEALPGYHVVFKPAVKNKLEGRPMNGMFVAVPEEIKSSVADVSPTNWRIQAIIITTNNGKRLLIINTYFPQDPRTAEFKSDDLEELLTDIKGIFEKNSFNDVVLTGDMNTDFSRNSGSVKRVKHFADEFELFIAWETHPIDFTHEFVKDEKSYTSTIDHFFWNRNVNDNTIEAGVYHDIDNTSDHHPIYSVLKYNSVKHDEIPTTEYKAKPSWKKASEIERRNFVQDLEDKLKKVEIPECLFCADIHCSETTHVEGIDDHMCKILKTIENCCKDNLPSPVINKSPAKKNRIASWNEEIQPYKENAQFWHSVWLSAGKPINSQLHMIMKRMIMEMYTTTKFESISR